MLKREMLIIILLTITTLAMPMLSLAASEKLTLVGKLEGIHPRKITAQGNYAYVLDANKMMVFDISNPSSLKMITSMEIAVTSNCGQIKVADHYAYIGCGNEGLQIWDISNPAMPIKAGQYITSVTSRNLFICHPYAYMLADNVLKVLNISDACAPSLTAIHALPGTAWDITGAGQYLYIADGDYGLRILDISDPGSPTETGYAYLPGRAMDIAVAGNYAYVNADTGLRIIDIGNPSAPFEAAHVDRTYSYCGLEISGNHVYLGDYPFTAIDITNPLTPVIDSTFEMNGFAMDFTIQSQHAVFAKYEGSIEMVDISNPNDIKRSSLFTRSSRANALCVAGNYAYVAARYEGIRVIDVSRSDQPLDAGVIQEAWLDDNEIFIQGDTLYFISYGRLNIFDIRNPVMPAKVGELLPGTYVKAIYFYQNMIYAFTYANRLLIINAKDPLHCQVESEIKLSGDPVIMICGQNLLYVAVQNRGLSVIDVGNAGSPVLVSENIQINPQNICVSGRYLYTLEGSAFNVYDRTDSTSFRKISSCIMTEFPNDLALSGQYAYVANHKGILAFDASSPTSIYEAAHYEIEGDTKHLFADGPYIYLTVDDSGLYIFQALTNGYVTAPAPDPMLEIRGGEKGYVDPEKGEHAAIILRPQQSGEVKASIYSLRGQMVWWQSIRVGAGNLGNIRWDAVNMQNEKVASGVYLVHVKGAGLDEKRKVMVIR